MAEKRIDDEKLGRVSGGTGYRVSPDDPANPPGGAVIGGTRPPIGGQPAPETDGTGGAGNKGVTG